jgi:hypothetical protein
MRAETPWIDRHERRREEAEKAALSSLQRADRCPAHRELFVRNAGALNAAAGWYAAQMGLASLVPECFRTGTGQKSEQEQEICNSQLVNGNRQLGRGQEAAA